MKREGRIQGYKMDQRNEQDDLRKIPSGRACLSLVNNVPSHFFYSCADLLLV
jgi:hypothetical protein